jgi:hypothetical protein
VTVPLSLALTAYVLFWEHAALAGNLASAITGIPLLLAVVYLLVGRFFARVIGRRRRLYAITTQRVVVVRQGGRVIRELAVTTPERVAPGGRRGLATVFFEPDPVQ